MSSPARTLEPMSTDSGSDDRGTRLRVLRDDTRTRLEALEAAVAQLRSDRGTDVADDEHDPEGVTLSTEWARLEGLREAALRELAQIDEALARRGGDTDGVCEDCGRDIPLARLQVRPTATRCVDCAARAGV